MKYRKKAREGQIANKNSVSRILSAVDDISINDDRGISYGVGSTLNNNLIAQTLM